MGRSRFIRFINLRSGEKTKTAGWKECWNRWGNWKPGGNSRQPGTDYRSYHLSSKEWLKYGSIGVGIAGLTAFTFYRNLVVFFCMLPMGLCYPTYKKKELLKKRSNRLRSEFKDGILILASSLSAGYSVENAFLTGVRELEVLYGSDSMMVEEFRLISAQLRMNRPVELLLLDLGERSGLDEIRNFAQVFAVAKRSGGELVGVINHTAGVIRDQIQVQEEILTMTAKRQMEQRIMNGLPFFLILYMELSSPGFFGLMYETGLGRMVMTVCLAVYLAAFEMAKRILQIPI